MSREAVIFISLAISIPILGLIGFQLQNMLGHKKFRGTVLPIGKFLLSVLLGKWFAQSLDPHQWQTDRKSLVLLFIGLPLGLLLLGGLTALIIFLIS